jgi:hypothetical protein
MTPTERKLLDALRPFAKFDELYLRFLDSDYFPLPVKLGAFLEAARLIAEIEKKCDHKHYSFAKHGRVCTCGAMMKDWGD